MSGADYAHCAHCGTKAFYDADTEIGSAAVFHDKCLPEHDAAVAAKALREAADAAEIIKEHAGGGNLVRQVSVVKAGTLQDRADRIEREAGESDAER